MKVIDEAKCVYALTETTMSYSFEDQKDYCKENIPKGGCEKCVGEMLTYHTAVKVKNAITKITIFSVTFFTSCTEQSNTIQDELWENRGWVGFPDYLIGGYRPCSHCSWHWTDGSPMTAKL